MMMNVKRPNIPPVSGSAGGVSRISCGRANAKLQHVNLEMSSKATESGRTSPLGASPCSSAQVHFGRALHQEANLPG